MSAPPNPSGICLCGCGRPTPIAKRTWNSRGVIAGEHVKFAEEGCQNRARAIEWNLAAVMERVEVDEHGCWMWRGRKNAGGYGQVVSRGKSMNAHQFVYGVLVGPTPVGMVLDHTCHTEAVKTCPGGDTCPHRACVNPGHLEPVTPLENNLRSKRHAGDECPNGHRYEGWNLILTPAGRKRCRECRNRKLRAYRRRLREKRDAA